MAEGLFYLVYKPVPSWVAEEAPESRTSSVSSLVERRITISRQPGDNDAAGHPRPCRRVSCVVFVGGWPVKDSFGAMMKQRGLLGGSRVALGTPFQRPSCPSTTQIPSVSMYLARSHSRGAVGSMYRHVQTHFNITP